MPPRYYKKKLESPERLHSEVAGYTFFSKYYNKIPKRTSVSGKSGASEVCYEYLLTSKRLLLGSSITQANDVNLRDMFRSLADIVNRHAVKRFAEGGTRAYYCNRLQRLTNGELACDYMYFVDQHPEIQIGDLYFSSDPHLLEKISNKVASLQYGWCAPTHGDLHELNIFSDGHLIDFEGAGWNHIATDIATFLQHILFIGNHFGPRYAKWADDKDKQALQHQAPQLVYDSGVVNTSISKARFDLAGQFLANYVAQINVIDNTMEDQIAAAIAFRLLTVFEILSMNSMDRRLAYVLANYFANDKPSLANKLQDLRLANSKANSSPCMRTHTNSA